MFSAARDAANEMRDKKDKATLELPGFDLAAPCAPLATDIKRASGPRARVPALRQEQLPLLEETDASGLPVWRRDDNTDLSGLPIWETGH